MSPLQYSRLKVTRRLATQFCWTVADRSAIFFFHFCNFFLFLWVFLLFSRGGNWIFSGCSVCDGSLSYFIVTWMTVRVYGQIIGYPVNISLHFIVIAALLRIFLELVNRLTGIGWSTLWFFFARKIELWSQVQLPSARLTYYYYYLLFVCRSLNMNLLTFIQQKRTLKLDISINQY